MNWLALARALHVLAVVIWIGGVAMVTTTLLSSRAFPSREARAVAFEAIERRFSKQARWMVIIAGGSGLYMLYGLNAWSRFAYRQYWWMHAMVCIWLIFAVMLFIVEPFFMHRAGAGKGDPQRRLRRMQIMHWVLLTASLVTILGAVSGAHGGLLG